MSDTIELLRRYRLAFAHDDEAFGALAVLLKRGSATEAQIATEMSLPPADVSRLLRRLFRAQVLSVKNDWYSLNEAGGDIAFQFGLLGLATHDYLKLTNLNEAELEFLTACVNVQVASKKEYSEMVLHYLRSWIALQKYEVLDKEDVSRLGRRVTFAVVTGFDPDLHRFGAERYYDFVIRSPLNVKVYNSPAFLQHKDVFVAHCKAARADTTRSDEYLYFDSRDWTTMDVQGKDGVFALTLIRLVSDLLGTLHKPSHPDYDLETAWLDIASWRPTVTERVASLLKELGVEGESGRIGADDLEQWFKSVSEGASRAAAGRTHPQSRTRGTHLLPPNDQPSAEGGIMARLRRRIARFVANLLRILKL